MPYAPGMRLAAIILSLVACTEHGQTPPGGGSNNDPSKPPPNCGCITERPPLFGECCNSVVCSFNEETQQWDITICDALPPPFDAGHPDDAAQPDVP